MLPNGIADRALGQVVKLAGSDVDLAAEAINTKKTPSPSRASKDDDMQLRAGTSHASSSRDPPAYTDTYDDPQTARPQSEKGIEFDSSSDSEDEMDDVDIWELDDAAEEVDPPAYAEVTRQQSVKPVDELAQAVLDAAQPARCCISRS